MPRDYPRSLRIAEQIHREIAVMLRENINDPRVSDFSITEVVVNKDLSVAKIYYTPFSSAQEIKELQKGLESCAAYLRRELGKMLRIRIIPQLVFHYDDTTERSTRLEEILTQEKVSKKRS